MTLRRPRLQKRLLRFYAGLEDVHPNIDRAFDQGESDNTDRGIDSFRVGRANDKSSNCIFRSMQPECRLQQ